MNLNQIQALPPIHQDRLIFADDKGVNYVIPADKHGRDAMLVGNAIVPSGAPFWPPQAFVDAMLDLNADGNLNGVNVDVTNVDASTLTTKYVNLAGKSLNRTVIDAIIAKMVSNGQTSGYLNLSGNKMAVPSSTGLTNVATLISRGWEVITASPYVSVKTRPVISGSDEIGSTLARVAATWNNNLPITVTRQWKVNGVNAQNVDPILQYITLTGSAETASGKYLNVHPALSVIDAGDLPIPIGTTKEAAAILLRDLINANEDCVAAGILATSAGAVVRLEVPYEFNGSYFHPFALASTSSITMLGVPYIPNTGSPSTNATGTTYKIPSGLNYGDIITYEETASAGGVSVTSVSPQRFVHASGEEPTHPLLPILGWLDRKPVWVDNDEGDDSFMEIWSIAAHRAGRIRIVGQSNTTSFGEYNPTIVGHYVDVQQPHRQLEIDLAAKAGWIVRDLPALGAMWKGNCEQPVTGVIEHTLRAKNAVTGSRGHTSTAALLAAIAAHATAENPLVFCAGGTLTLIADAYLADPSIADKVVVCFVAGGTLSDYTGDAKYNEWADAWAAHIVFSRLRTIIVPTQNYTTLVPQVTTQRLLSDLPASQLRERLATKKHWFNPLPGGYDADGEVVVLAAEPGYVTGVVRKSVSGSAPFGIERDPLHWDSDPPTRNIPTLADDEDGNIWYVTAASQSVATDTWWEVMTRPYLWSGEEPPRGPVWADADGNPYVNEFDQLVPAP